MYRLKHEGLFKNTNIYHWKMNRKVPLFDYKKVTGVPVNTASVDLDLLTIIITECATCPFTTKAKLQNVRD